MLARPLCAQELEARVVRFKVKREVCLGQGGVINRAAHRERPAHSLTPGILSADPRQRQLHLRCERKVRVG